MDHIEVFGLSPNGLSNDSIAVMDTWQNLRVTRNFTKPNDFTLTVVASEANLENLKPKNHIRIGTVLYDIETINSDGLLLTAMGRSMSHQMSRGYQNYTFSRNSIEPEMAAELIIWGLGAVQSKFLHGERIEPFSDFKIRYQFTYRDYLEVITELCETYDFGYKETFAAKGSGVIGSQYVNINSIRVIKGSDLSDKVIFSVENENLLSESLEISYKDYKNYAVVYGEGEGIHRKYEVVDIRTPEDETFSQLYVDARDLQSEVEDGVVLSDAEYEEMLRDRGLKKLAEHAPVFSLSGTIDAKSKLFKLGVDYDVGDIVTIESEKFNIKTNLQITSIQETWDSTGYHIDPIFGKESPTIFEKLRR